MFITKRFIFYWCVRKKINPYDLNQVADLDARLRRQIRRRMPTDPRNVNPYDINSVADFDEELRRRAELGGQVRGFVPDE